MREVIEWKITCDACGEYIHVSSPEENSSWIEIDEYDYCPSCREERLQLWKDLTEGKKFVTTVKIGSIPKGSNVITVDERFWVEYDDDHFFLHPDAMKYVKEVR